MVHTTTAQYAGQNLQYIIYQLESVNATQHPFIVLHPGLLYTRKSVTPFWSKILSIKEGKGPRKRKACAHPSWFHWPPKSDQSQGSTMSVIDGRTGQDNVFNLFL